MSEELVRQKLEGNLQAGSLAQLVKERKGEQGTWLLVDTSSSMHGSTSDYSQTRKIDALRKVVQELSQTIACPMLQFASDCELVIDGRIREPMGSTNLTFAIHDAQRRGAQHLIVISDGQPDSEASALQAARAFARPIDVFYVGPAGDYGAQFLAKLARASGGQSQTISLAQTKQLTSAIRGLIGS